MAYIFFTEFVFIKLAGGWLFQVIRKADTYCLGKVMGLPNVTVGNVGHCLEPG